MDSDSMKTVADMSSAEATPALCDLAGMLTGSDFLTGENPTAIIAIVEGCHASWCVFWLITAIPVCWC